jgi:hypothetical protein
VLLSVGPRLGLAAATVAHVLQPLAFAASVALCGAWLARHVASPGWRIAALALLTLSTIGIESAAFVWTESWDLLFTLGCLFALDRWADTGRSRMLLVATACAALACLTRYASAVLVPVGALAILLAPESAGTSRLARWAAAAGFAVGAALPLAPWLWRNVRLHEGLVGITGAGGFSWAELSAQMGNAASHWVAPESSPPAVRIAALGFFAIVVLLTLVAGFRRAPRNRSAWFAPGLLLAFAGAHKLAVLVGAHAAAVERVDERYLAPLFAPLVLVLAWAADRATAAPARPALGRGLAVLTGIWLAFTALRTADRMRGYLGNGAWGLNNARWERSAVLAAVRRAPPLGLVYSNAPDALYALAHVEARLWPRRYVYNSPRTTVDDLARYRADVVSAGGATLVWFKDLDRDYLVPPRELVTGAGTRTTGGVYADGFMWRVERVPATTTR